MEYITLDFETYYDKEYSLRKMTPVEYVLDPRYETIMLAVKRPGKEPFALEADQVQRFFDLLDPNETVLISHNALFDMCIVVWRYNFVPRLMVDTMSIARACLGHKLKSLSLESVALHLKLGVKGGAVKQMVGLRTADIKAAGYWPDYVAYGKLDSTLCEGIFDKLVRGGEFPFNELIVTDMVIRATVLPQFSLNQVELAEHHADILQQKQNLLGAAMSLGADGRSSLMSDNAFAELLRKVGVEPPTKISPVTGRENYAFAKSDKAFTDLEEHPNPDVQALVAARLGHKSTIEETRTLRMLNIANLEWPIEHLQKRGLVGEKLMPVPLRYSGAHTHRLSGDWKLNLQNLPARGKINHLKRALMARPGFKVLNIDSSQIEARIVAWLAREWELLKQFEDGLDPYRLFAAKVFNIPPPQITSEQRFLGKTSILGLGFGLGWAKFKAQVRIKSLEAAKYSGSGSEIILPDEEAVRIVTTYRTTFPGVPNAWSMLNNGIGTLAGNRRDFSFGPCHFEQGKIALPNGLYLHYHNLAHTSDGWQYEHAGKPRRLYGGALLENIVQALARIIVMDAACRIRVQLEAMKAPHDWLPISLALQCHDALAYVVPDELVTTVGNIMMTEMNRRPTWAPELPLAAELKSGANYGDCK